MNIFKSGAIAGAYIFAAIGFSSAVAASPLGGASRDLATAASETNSIIEVQAKFKDGTPKSSGGKKGAAANGTINSASGGNKQWSGNSGGSHGGGGHSGNHGGGGNNSGRNAAAIGAGVALLGGLIAADQERRTDQVQYRRCPYGSYINRHGERRCRR
jgi:hypothetical protein